MPAATYSLIVPSLLGGIIGAVLLEMTPTAVFDRLIPLLILFATLLFMLQEPVQRLIKTTGKAHAGSKSWLIGALLFQFLVSLYGGYFGAGIGILMLAAFGIMGFTDIHQMNGLKNFLALCINGVAAFYFIWNGMVSWPHALVMAAGADRGRHLGRRRRRAGSARRACAASSSSSDSRWRCRCCCGCESAWAANRDDLFSVTSLKHYPYVANSDFHKPKHLYSWKTLVRSAKPWPAVRSALKANVDIAITLYRR